jgi:hypothetical protein
MRVKVLQDYDSPESYLRLMKNQVLILKLSYSSRIQLFDSTDLPWTLDCEEFRFLIKNSIITIF